MPTKSSPNADRDVAHLIAYSAADDVVLEIRLSLAEYYEELHPLIDSDEFRVKHGVRRLLGRLYDSHGKETQEYLNKYSADGALVYSRAQHDDGTVTEFPA